jgi:hypothetical protein
MMNIEYEKDNKERVPFEHYKEEYVKKDPMEISSRTGFPYSEEKQCFTVTFLGKDYEVGFPEFTVKRTEEDNSWCPLVEMTAAQILVIRFLIEGSQVAGNGTFLTYREVPWGEVYYRQFNGRCMMRLAFSYGSRIDAFRTALEKMGALPIKAGDAGYEIELMKDYRIRFQIWAGDDEFPPSSQILFSDNFATAFHAEDLVVACDVIIGTMKKQF